MKNQVHWLGHFTYGKICPIDFQRVSQKCEKMCSKHGAYGKVWNDRCRNTVGLMQKMQKGTREMKSRLALFVIVLFLICMGCERQGAETVDSLPAPVLESSATATEKPPAFLHRDRMLEDYDYLVQIIRDNYPFLHVNERLTGVDWLAAAAAYRESVPQSATYPEFMAWLQSILKELHNGHTGVVSTQSDYQSRCRIYAGREENKPWADLLADTAVKALYEALGEEARAVGSGRSQSPASLTLLSLSSQTAYINLPSFQSDLIPGHMVLLSEFLSGMKDKENLIIDIRENSGGSDTYWMKLVKRLISEPISWKYYNLVRGSYIEPFAEAKTGVRYKTLDSVQSLPAPVLAGLPKDAVQDFNKYFTADHRLEPEDSIRFQGKVYLLVSRRVFSSSEKFASFAKSTGWATLVGERTGGDGLGTDPVLVKLPQSHVMVRFPFIMGVTEGGVINEEKKTEPDIWVNAAKDDNVYLDLAVKAVMADIESRTSKSAQ